MLKLKIRKVNRKEKKEKMHRSEPEKPSDKHDSDDSIDSEVPSINIESLSDFESQSDDFESEDDKPTKTKKQADNTEPEFKYSAKMQEPSTITKEKLPVKLPSGKIQRVLVEEKITAEKLPKEKEKSKKAVIPEPAIVNYNVDTKSLSLAAAQEELASIAEAIQTSPEEKVEIIILFHLDRFIKKIGVIPKRQAINC